MKKSVKKIAIGVTAVTAFSIVPFVQPVTAEASWLDAIGSVIGAVATPKNAVKRNSATQIDKILHQACVDNDYDLAVDAINKGANVNSHWKDDLPLAHALFYVQKGDTRVADLLIAHGADVEGWYDKNWKHYFAFDGYHNNVVLYLLDHGLNINLRGNYGETLLMNRTGRDVYYEDHPRSYYVQQYVNRGADVNARCTNDGGAYHQYKGGQTALFAAAEMNDIETARVLLYAGANKNIKDRFGKTALDYAIDDGHMDMVKLLMNWNGAN